MTCKECLHCEVCMQESLATDISPYIDYSIRNDVEKECENFIDEDNVVEVRRGEWIRDEWSCFYPRYNCSVCGNGCMRIGVQTNFCPNCGADMRGNENG